MPRPCSICNHQERSAIESALEAGQTLRSIAGRFGVSTAALSRHRGHMKESLEKIESPTRKPGEPVNTVTDENFPIEGLAIFCLNCGEGEIYFDGWDEKHKVAIIECPWCLNRGYISGFTVASIGLTVGSVATSISKAPLPPWRKTKRNK